MGDSDPALFCRWCRDNPLSHDARCFGVDGDGDPVFMNCFLLPRQLDPESIYQHMTCLMEKILREYDRAPGEPRWCREQLQSSSSSQYLRKKRRWLRWTWVVDLTGFGLKHCDPRTSYKLLKLLQVAYRNRLKRCIVL